MPKEKASCKCLSIIMIDSVIISLSCHELTCHVINLLVHDMINLLYYECWTDKQKYLYVKQQGI